MVFKKEKAKASASTVPDQFRRAVHQQLTKIVQHVNRISEGDISIRIDPLLSDKTFTELCAALNTLSGSLDGTKKAIEVQNRHNRLRTMIWRMAIQAGTTECQLIQQLLDAVGTECKVDMTSFFRFDPTTRHIVCEQQWSADGVSSTVGTTMRFPGYKKILKGCGPLFTSDWMKKQAPEIIEEFLKRFNVKSFAAVLYGDPDEPEGFFTFADCTTKRKWTNVETDILTEVVTIFTTRIAQIKAEARLNELNLELERKVADRTTALDAANRKLMEDITARHSIEVALGESEKQYRIIVDSLADPVFSVDAECRFLLVNKAFIRTFCPQKKTAELVGTSMFDALPGLPLRVREEYQRVFRQKSIQIVEERCDCQDAEFVFDVQRIPVMEHGEVVRVVTVMHDVTQRTSRETSMTESEYKFRTLAESAATGIFIVQERKFAYVNKYLVDSLGYSGSELLGMDFLNITHSDVRDTLMKRYECYISGENTLNSRFDVKVLMKDGTERWIDLTVAVTEFDGRPALLGTGYDITDSREMLKALVDSEQRFRTLLEKVPTVAVQGFNGDGVINYWNHASEKLYGYTFDEALGKNIVDLIVPMQRREEFSAMLLEAIIAGEAPSAVEEVLQHKDGSKVLVFSSRAMIVRPGATAEFFSLDVDLTEQEKMREELFKARRLESLGLLAGGIAHDFNNNLTGIITNLFMAKTQSTENAEVYDLIDEAEKAAFKASKLTKQLLAFSKGGAPVKENASIRELIEESVGFCLSGSNVDYHLDIAEDLWPVDVDRGQIDQVLNNLIINADQAMPNGGTITVSGANVVIDSHGRRPDDRIPLPLNPGNYVLISISDEGVGIAQNDFERVFDPYFTTKKGGTGLGLTTAYSIIKNHDGYITIKPRPHKGTAVEFYLPASDSTDEGALMAIPQFIRGQGRILLMDDDHIVGIVIEKLLKNAGYDVHRVLDGELAIEEYEKTIKAGERFDAVIMDLTIPGAMGGREAIKKLLEIDPDARVIVSSGYSNDPVMANYKDYGFCGVIPKPFTVEEFTQVINKVINKVD